MLNNLSWGWDNARALLGLVVMFAILWGVSENRKALPWRAILGATLIQLAFALLFYGVPILRDGLAQGTVVVNALQDATRSGTNFVFGYVGDNTAWPVKAGAAPGPVFFFQILPLVIVVASLSAILWHWHVLRWVTKGFALVFSRLMGIGGATSLVVAANVFMGMTEAPLLIKPYFPKLTRSEILIVMTAGFGTIAAAVMAIYATMLEPVMHNALGQLLIASVMGTTGAVATALTIIPEMTSAKDRSGEPDFKYHSTMDAFSRGAGDGMQMVLNIAAMLIAALALLFIVNAILGVLPHIDGQAISVQRVLGWAFSPLMYMLGIPWSEAQKAGGLMGEKTVLNEFVAYIDLSQIPLAEMTDRTRRILSNALCGFANFGSIGIIVGGLSIISPDRREVFLSLAWKALLAGTFATCTSAAIMGLLPSALYAS
jgi:concentrative nucleoside transporter, CNT family